jgi:hypothetical protein
MHVDTCRNVSTRVYMHVDTCRHVCTCVLKCYTHVDTCLHVSTRVSVHTQTCRTCLHEARTHADECTRVYTQEFTYRFSPSKMQEVLLSNLSDLTVSFLRDTSASTEKVQYLIGLLDSIDGNLISIPQIWAAMPGHRRKRPGPNTLKGMV